MKVSNFHRNESGQVVAYVVAAMVLLFGAMALAIDLGFFFNARRIAQNAADPAALAGAGAFPTCIGGGDPTNVARDYANRNYQFSAFADGAPGVTPVPRKYSVDGADFDSMYVLVKRQQKFILARFVGQGASVNVPAEAEAVCAPVSGLNVCPFFLKAPDPSQDPIDLAKPYGLVPGDIYQFKGGSQAGDGGNRGFLGIWGSGGNEIKDGIADGCVDDGNLNVHVEGGQNITYTKPGNIASVWEAINCYYNFPLSKNGCAGYEGKPSTGYPSQKYCDIQFDINAFPNPTITDPYPHVSPSDALQQRDSTDPMDKTVAAKLRNCASDPDDADNIRGRWWPILITPDLADANCNGNCTITIKSIAMMYVACWGTASDNPSCGAGNPGQAALYGIFVESLPFLMPGGTGISNNPLAPKHVVLVK